MYIFATEGFNDLVLQRTVYSQIPEINPAKDVCLRSAVLHCNEEYSQQCVISNYGFIDLDDGETVGALCSRNSEDTTCETITFPTLSPSFSSNTSTPTMEPSVIPTLEPTSQTTINTNEETQIMNQTEKEFEKIEKDNSGWTDFELVLAILLPMMLVLCIAVCICVCSSERKVKQSHYSGYTTTATFKNTSGKSGNKSQSSYGFDADHENSSEWDETPRVVHDEEEKMEFIEIDKNHDQNGGTSPKLERSIKHFDVNDANNESMRIMIIEDEIAENYGDG